jgi:predicted class III extradiol MEMO1 family dioxygenase
VIEVFLFGSVVKDSKQYKQEEYINMRIPEYQYYINCFFFPVLIMDQEFKSAYETAQWNLKTDYSLLSRRLNCLNPPW